MRGRVVRELPFVVAAGEDLTRVGAHDDRADGYVIVLDRGSGFVEREVHQRFDLVALHERNLAVTQSSACWTAQSGLRHQSLDG